MNQRLTDQSLTNLFLFLSFFCLTSALEAQGIKGVVSDEQGLPLPFAGIVFVGSDRGIVTNINGEFSVEVAPGRHRLKLQYLGYRTLDTTIQVNQSFVTFNPSLQPEVVALPEAVVSGRGEDPAYTIMRRAIAKAKYHELQVDEYNAMVYVKGSGRLLKVPWLLRKKITKALAEEGIDSTVAFTSESVSKLHYIRPDQYRDTVISIRTVGDDNNTSPMGFIYSSFYAPKVMNAISPLAPDAFNHYRYEYLGFIESNGTTVNKIKVIPRGKGDQVFEGIIYIVDNVWSIHSLDLTTYIWGIKFDLQQSFSPVMPDVWMPVHEIYDVSGSVFGFAFEYRYFAQLKDHRVKLNPDLEVPVIVLDAKVETEEAKAAEEKFRNKKFDDGLTTMNPNEELSVKQLRKMMREYERQEIEALPEVDTVSIAKSTIQVIDSMAYKKDSLYWSNVRPMPLTDYEVKGYVRQDSIAAIPPEPGDNDDDDPDTLSVSVGEDGLAANIKRRAKFQPLHLVTGGRYKLNDHLYLQLKALLQTINFNTVDGFHAGYEIKVGNSADKKVNWELGPSIRYNQARETFNYGGNLRLFGDDWDVKLFGGKQTAQFNYDTPISPWINSLYSLFANRNYLKEYEKTFIRLDYDQEISKAIGFGISGEYAERTRLVNHTDLVFFDDKKLLYTSNDPDHVSDDPLIYDDHTAFITDASVWIRPFWKYKVYNATKRKDYSKSPSLTLRYRKGWGDTSEPAEDPFDLVAANFNHKFTVGAGSFFSMNIAAGKFIGDDKPSYLANYFHFPGNRLIASPINPVNSFRMLDYYLYSTNDEYVYGLFNYQFRRFALTQFDFFRRQGIRENVLFNTLLTPDSQHYAEVGYAINYILRVLRVEFVTSWQDYKYQDFAIRFGIATDFQSIFGF